ncbi:hypothetical protein P168DRAFT_326553 [Aspergillus campestris IBT 28561]|uniref:Uncharacterized protein n=1 Tax=Aspergillus campestris (strain IBT 28561) TaxID=1392248 RepID=A0A2I1D4F9_ASPC2|nr:uncharacterized protein P168DRAFT_326553 [Aspergillus campestris IBT 28561]PKY04764.1 hypothetical protein P168DRAFT_326553 [Aspergillus campestris IBT 28561]
MHLSPSLLLPLLSLLTTTSANVEKTIFLAPSPVLVPALTPNLDDLGLQRLSPSSSYLRTQLNASFPTTHDDPTSDPTTDHSNRDTGTDTWYFLENLTPGQRYEVRLCWLATQPTKFTLTTHHPHTTISTPALLTSLTLYSSLLLSTQPPKPLAAPLIPDSASSSSFAPHDPTLTSDSVLFLRVRAEADYYSLDQELMRSVPPVVVDVVLDPYLGNVFPRSLVRTAGWVVLVAGLAAGLRAGWLGRWGGWLLY